MHSSLRPRATHKLSNVHRPTAGILPQRWSLVNVFGTPPGGLVRSTGGLIRGWNGMSHVPISWLFGYRKHQHFRSCTRTLLLGFQTSEHRCKRCVFVDYMGVEPISENDPLSFLHAYLIFVSLVCQNQQTHTRRAVRWVSCHTFWTNFYMALSAMVTLIRYSGDTDKSWTLLSQGRWHTVRQRPS